MNALTLLASSALGLVQPATTPLAPSLPVAAVAAHSVDGYPSVDWVFGDETFATSPSTATDWIQSTITIPTAVSWSQPDQFVSGWLMGTEPNSTTDYTQIGWVVGDGDSSVPGTPGIFTESNDNGTRVDHSFPQYPISFGGSVRVAVSCDLNTTVWHDWIWGANRWQLLDTENTGATCDSALLEASLEVFNDSAGASDESVSGPVAFTNTQMDERGAQAQVPNFTTGAQ